MAPYDIVYYTTRAQSRSAQGAEKFEAMKRTAAHMAVRHVTARTHCHACPAPASNRVIKIATCAAYNMIIIPR